MKKELYNLRKITQGSGSYLLSFLKDEINFKPDEVIGKTYLYSKEKLENIIKVYEDKVSKKKSCSFFANTQREMAYKLLKEFLSKDRTINDNTAKKKL